MTGDVTAVSRTSGCSPRMKNLARQRSGQFNNTAPSPPPEPTPVNMPQQIQAPIPITTVAAHPLPQSSIPPPEPSHPNSVVPTLPSNRPQLRRPPRENDKLAKFVQDEESITLGMMAMERGDNNLQLHVQAVMSVKTTSIRTFKQDISRAIGWHEDLLLGGVICVKSLNNRGLHTPTGLTGYCLKDDNEQHFRMYSKNVTEERMEEGKRQHAILWAFRCCVKEMMRSGQYLPDFKWLFVPRISQFRAERLWQTAINSNETTMQDVDHLLFNVQESERYWRSSNANELRIEDARKKQVLVPEAEKDDIQLPEPDNDNDNEEANPDPADADIADPIDLTIDDEDPDIEIVDVDQFADDEEINGLLAGGFAVDRRPVAAGSENALKYICLWRTLMEAGLGSDD
ncbi:hypothetical protein R1sor_025588 [Riccia sorocarpa]|uniref:Replitron HUH endonuclease domain-containing protein n=1 Tax=Riccia sorocarpa TaxID=122646 RepID=A0ABD3GC94_9MARC